MCVEEMEHQTRKPKDHPQPHGNVATFYCNLSEIEVGSIASGVSNRTARNDGKIVVIGNSGVGKTSIVYSFANPHEDWRTCQSTPYMDITTVRVNFDDGYAMRLAIHDTAGTERFDSIPPSLIRSADVVVVVCSVGDPDIEGSVVHWNKKIAYNEGFHSIPAEALPVRIIVANKEDVLSPLSDESSACAPAVPSREERYTLADEHDNAWYYYSPSGMDPSLPTPKCAVSRTREDVARILDRLTSQLGLAGFWIVSAKTKKDLVDLMCAIAIEVRKRKHLRGEVDAAFGLENVVPQSLSPAHRRDGRSGESSRASTPANASGGDVVRCENAALQGERFRLVAQPPNYRAVRSSCGC